MTYFSLIAKRNKKQDANRVMLQIAPDQTQIITDQADDLVSRSTTIANTASGAGTLEKVI
jgi:hypothetical protein